MKQGWKNPKRRKRSNDRYIRIGVGARSVCADRESSKVNAIHEWNAPGVDGHDILINEQKHDKFNGLNRYQIMSKGYYMVRYKPRKSEDEGV